MRIILLKDVEKLGKKYDVKQVTNGYARNFLIRKGLAKPATKESLEWLKIQKEIITKKVEEELKKVQDLASKIDGLEIIFEVKVTEKKEPFESINSQKIFEKLKEMGFEIRKNQLNLENPIKEMGEFPIKIRFEHNLEAEIKVITVEKK